MRDGTTYFNTRVRRLLDAALDNNLYVSAGGDDDGRYWWVIRRTREFKIGGEALFLFADAGRNAVEVLHETRRRPAGRKITQKAALDLIRRWGETATENTTPGRYRARS
jgi:hypothetical protein